MSTKSITVFAIVTIVVNKINANIQLDRDVGNPAFDPSFYKKALDPQQCAEQLAYLGSNNTLLRIQFLEAGLRIPRSILTGNMVDLGNYHQCLGINEELGDMVVEGKYCLINVPLTQSFEVPEFPGSLAELNEFNPNKLQIEQETVKRLEAFESMNDGLRTAFGIDGVMRTIPEGLGDLEFTLAVCVPKVCTTQEGISGLLFDVTALGLKYTESSCRLRNDKPWVPADYVAVVLFSTIGLLTLLSTSYDIYQTFVLRTDPKSISTIGRSFSLYTNTRRLTTFVSNPGSLECIDGIRAVAMIWVIVGHTFLTLPPVINGLDGLEWQASFRSFWITQAPITVDTFLMLSGLLLVYTTVGKLSSMKLLRNLHLFYLNRFLRMFPLLGVAVLLQASILHRIADGPLWEDVAVQTNNCRLNWWITMLYVQNYVSTATMCIGHTWYLAVDMHLHLVSPIVLYWVLSGKRNVAWIGLTAGLLAALVGTTIYNFIMEFPGSAMAPARHDDSWHYSTFYYINSFARASPFFVGMIFGYLLHSWRGSQIKISKLSVGTLWIFAMCVTTAAMLATHPMKDINWDNQTVDSLVNSFMRPAWAAGLGWIIFACAQGYGGPVNWFLSLSLWKLPSRLSYAMYLFHYPMMFVFTGTYMAPIYFSEVAAIYIFFSQFVLVFMVSFAITLVADSPFSTIVKLLLGGGPKKRSKEDVDKN